MYSKAKTNSFFQLVASKQPSCPFKGLKPSQLLPLHNLDQNKGVKNECGTRHPYGYGITRKRTSQRVNSDVQQLYHII